MGELTPRQLTPFELGTVVTAIIALGTFLVVKVWPAYREWRAERRVDEDRVDEKTQAGYDVVVADLRTRLDKAEVTISKLMSEHLECIRLQAAATAERDAARRDVHRLEEYVKRLEERISALEAA